MCWLYMRSTKDPHPVSNPYLRKFYSKGGDINPDGWGLTSYMSKTKDFTLVKEPRNASNSLVAHAVSIKSGLPKTRMVIAHVRKKTAGVRSYRNTQPMIRQSVKNDVRWAFVHNGVGTVAGIQELNADILANTDYKPVTGLDSERLFLEFLDCVDRVLPAGDESKASFNTIRELLDVINEHAKMCVIGSNGELTFAYRDYLSRRNLYYLKDEAGYFVCTVELTKKENWISLLPGQMLVFKKGEMIYDSLRGSKLAVVPKNFKGKDYKPVYKSHYALNTPEYLMGKDNFREYANEMRIFEDLDEETSSIDRRHYSDDRELGRFEGWDGFSIVEQ